MKLFSRDTDSDTADWRSRLTNLPTAVKWGVIGAVLVAGLLLAWLGVQGMNAKSHLEQARGDAQRAKNALFTGKSDDAVRFAENTQFHAYQARAATHSIPWNIAAAVPLLGSPLKTAQQISDVVVRLADDVLIPAASMGGAISPDKLIDGTRINLQLLRSEQPRLIELAAAASRIDSQSQGIVNSSYLSVIRDARAQVQGETARLSQLLDNTALASRLAPPMLGADGPRRYLLVFQNPAEARGTGGLLGGVGVLRFDNGIPSIETVRTNYELLDATAKVDLGPEFTNAYGWMNPLSDFRNSNMSPHFPYAAQIWKSMWENKIAGGGPGQPVDGVIALDPVALSYVLGAIGPVTLPDGEVVNQDNLVELTMSQAYFRYADVNQVERKGYLQAIGDQIVKKIERGPLPDPRKLLDALGRAASEGRVSMWSAFPVEQELLEQTALAHIVPADNAPYAEVVVNNLGGNKMDYYLKRDIEYAADSCPGKVRNSTITVRLTNTATDPSLPFTVGGASGLATGLGLNVPNGTMVSSVKVIATKGARLMGVTSNGERTSAISGTERGHPTFEVQVAIPLGQSGELTFRLSEPTSGGEPVVRVQPLADNVVPTLSVPECPE